jgi:hypothetical protein
VRSLFYDFHDRSTHIGKNDNKTMTIRTKRDRDFVKKTSSNTLPADLHTRDLQRVIVGSVVVFLVTEGVSVDCLEADRLLLGLLLVKLDRFNGRKERVI